jgi:hypothetical protein
MFKFLKKGKAVNNLAKSFNRMYLILQEIEQNPNPNPAEFRESILLLAYIATKGVFDRMDENDISMEHKIMIPTIQRGFIAVFYAYQQTVGKLITISNMLEMDDIVTEILDKGPAYYELENRLPAKVVNNI